MFSDEVHFSELVFKDYNVFRCDRNIHTSRLAGGGGPLVQIAACNKISRVEGQPHTSYGGILDLCIMISLTIVDIISIGFPV